MRNFYVIIIFLFAASSYLFGQATADFSISDTEGCGTLQVQFSDLSTSSAGNIVSWEWNLGGTISDLQNPGKIFNLPNIYTICLTVTDEAGNTSELCKDNSITVFALPEVEFIGDPILGCVPLVTQYTSQSSSANGAITKYIWGLGGTAGVMELTENLPVINTYNQVDNFNISLTVEDEKGCTTTLSKSDYVTTFGIDSIQLYSSDSVSCNNPHAADILILNPGTGIIYNWDLGNGATAVGSSTSAVYNEFGQFDITIFAFNPSAGCRDTFTFKNFITVGLDLEIFLNRQVICLGQSVLLRDNSNISGGQILWDLGDGNTFTSKQVIHTYDEPGCYFVSLTKTIDNCTSTKTLLECIEVIPAPEVQINFDKKGTCQLPANFQAEVTGTDLVRYHFMTQGDSTIQNGTNPNTTFTFEEEGIYPIKVVVRGFNGCYNTIYDTLYVGDVFINQSVEGPNGCSPVSVTDLGTYFSSPFNITSWDWILYTNPIQNWNIPNPSFTLSDTGAFDLQIVFENDEGCKDSLLLNNYVRAGMQPDVDFSAEPLFACVDSFVQFNSSSSSFANEFLWDFGDGGISILPNPPHEYGDTGIFSVTLEVGHFGCNELITFENYIRILPPISKFIFDVNCESNEVSFTNQSIGADSYYWDFGVPLDNSANSIEEHPTFQFPTSGIYPITLLVENFQTGCTDKLEISVDLRGIDVSFQIDTVEGCLPLQFRLEGEGQEIVRWEWKAPGALIEDDTMQSTFFNFRNRGQYPFIQLIGESAGGCLDTFLYADTITVHKPFAIFDVIPNIFCGNDTIALLDSSISRFSPLVKWDWNVGDSLYLFNEQFPKFYLDSIDAFSISLTVTDAFGCSHTAAIDSAISFFIPDPSFTGDTIQCPGLPLQFQVDSPQENAAYSWDFGDGNFSSEASPTHNYMGEGQYDVCLNVSNGAGCDSTICKVEYVEITTPFADFSADTTFANCPPLVVQFENLSTNASDYRWRFGDGGGISDLKNPGHVYTEPGSYSVSLVARVSAQCIDTIQKPNLIKIEGPEGDFTMEVDTTCAPVKVEFFGTSLDEYDYIWDFGDGQLDSSEMRTMTDTSTYFYFKKGKYLPKLILIDNEDCLRSFSAPDSIEVLTSAGAFLSADTIICLGDEITINADLADENTSISHEWSANPNLSCASCLETTVKPDTTQKYYFQTIAENGCIFEDSIEVQVQILPTVDFVLSNDTTLCFGDSIDILATSENDNSTFEWDYNPNNICTECPQISIQLYDTTLYSLVVRDSLGCKGAGEIIIDVLPAFIPFAPTDQIICENDTAFVEITNLAFVEWPITSNFDCDTCFKTFYLPESSDCIPLIAKNALGCVLKDTFCVTVRSTRELFAGDDKIICFGETVVLEAESFGEVYWSPSADLTQPNSSQTVAQPDSTTTYVISSSEGTCTLVDSVTINVIYKASIDAIGDSICIMDIADINISGNAEMYSWPDELMGEFISLDSTNHLLQSQVLESGTFPIIGNLSTCAPDTAFIDVAVYDSVSFSLVNNILDYPDHSIPLNLDIIDVENYSFDWSPPALFDCPSCPQPMVSLDSTQNLFVTVTDNRTGCSATDSIVFRVLASCKVDEFIFIPNTFTPNGDNVNDKWGLFSDVHQEIYSLRVFDRWGTQVWGTVAFDDRWDGTLNGEVLPSGVYVYSVEGPCAIDGNDFVIKGTVTLLK